MILLCTFTQEGFGIEEASPLSHRLCMDFLTRIGIDGAAPHIGENGNWWLLEEDTGVPAGMLRRFASHLEFPNVGNGSTLYLDEETNKLYQWDAASLHYYAVGSNYEDIKIIHGGNA